TIQHDLRDFHMSLRRLVEARRHDLANAPGDCLAHFLGTFVDEKNEQHGVGVIHRHAFGDRMEQRRLAGAGRCDDECTLSVADRRNEIDRAARELGAALRRTAGLHEQLSFWVRRRQGIEFRPLGGELWIGVVDRAHFDDGRSAALVDPDGCVDQIGAPELELSHHVWRHVRIARFGEIAVRGPANKARVARRVEPSAHLAGRDDLHRLLWAAAAAAGASWTLLMLASRPASTATTTMSASAAAAAIPPIVEVVAAPAPAPAPAILSAIETAVAIRRALRLLVAAARCAALRVILIPRWCRSSVVRRGRAYRVDTVGGVRAALALRSRR